MIYRSDTITTSFHSERIEIKIIDLTITIVRLPEWSIKNPVMIQITDSTKKCLFQEVKQIAFPHIINLENIADGDYVLQIYYKPKAHSTYYFALNKSIGFPFQMINNKAYTIIAKPFESNKKKYIKLNEQFVKSYDCFNTCGSQFIPESIVILALAIIKDCFSNYDKILAIHDWVARNIYYDYDSIDDESYKMNHINAVYVLNRKRTVCAGYSELTVTLLKAVGVPATSMHCFSLSEETGTSWEKISNMSDDANHVMTFAYADDRWIMLDTTWDSPNKYRNGVFIENNNEPISRQYFDCTLAFFSYTHRFVKYIL